MIVCEGWDASGKGGAIQRLTAECDPRAYQVWPIAAPTEEEKAHHFLWRFWPRLPAAGEVAIFDRSWYGRVLVERVEGFASEAEWRRAYDEINEFEAQLAADGCTIVKLFFHITTGDPGRAPARPPRSSLEALEGERGGSAQPRPAQGLCRGDQGHVRAHRHALGAVDGDRRQRQEVGADRGLTRVGDALAAALPADPPPIRPEMEKLARELSRKRD